MDQQVIKGHKVAVNDDPSIGMSHKRADVVPQHLLDEVSKMNPPKPIIRRNSTKNLAFDPTKMDPKTLGIDVNGGPVKIVHVGPDGKQLGVQTFKNGRQVPSYLPIAAQQPPAKVLLTKEKMTQQSPRRSHPAAPAYAAYGTTQHQYPGHNPNGMPPQVAVAVAVPPYPYQMRAYGMSRQFAHPMVYAQVAGYPQCAGYPQPAGYAYPTKKHKKKKKKKASSSSSNVAKKGKKYKMHVHQK